MKSRWHRRHSAGAPPNISLGRKGERAAERYLKRQGLKFHSRNVSLPGGEIDLIFEDADRTIVFVEVKTRMSDEFRGEWAINAKKRRRLIQLAQRIAKRHCWARRKLRIDIVVVVMADRGKPEIRHHPNAVTLT